MILNHMVFGGSTCLILQPRLTMCRYSEELEHLQMGVLHSVPPWIFRHLQWTLIPMVHLIRWLTRMAISTGHFLTWNLFLSAEHIMEKKAYWRSMSFQGRSIPTSPGMVSPWSYWTRTVHSIRLEWSFLPTEIQRTMITNRIITSNHITSCFIQGSWVIDSFLTGPCIIPMAGGIMNSISRMRIYLITRSRK